MSVSRRRGEWSMPHFNQLVVAGMIGAVVATTFKLNLLGIFLVGVALVLIRKHRRTIEGPIPFVPPWRPLEPRDRR
ncbi:hypothetical protein Pan216_26560 [Planctomycetes bacterium Pan216]|uniref:Uncharacterized protein n=1 Tax=Kolteria novifilia TaxID=2527975 RepID=A0A518B478_9BACT|nr:hypothetical protein Pan216_26560 [Planctomycetes bacterium Pan216]